MNHRLRAHRLRPLDRLRERIGAIVAVRDDAHLHAAILAQRTMFPDETQSRLASADSAGAYSIRH